MALLQVIVIRRETRRIRRYGRISSPIPKSVKLKRDNLLNPSTLVLVSRAGGSTLCRRISGLVPRTPRYRRIRLSCKGREQEINPAKPLGEITVPGVFQATIRLELRVKELPFGGL